MFVSPLGLSRGSRVQSVSLWILGIKPRMAWWRGVFVPVSPLGLSRGSSWYRLLMDSRHKAKNDSSGVWIQE
jgi:hypothetical protein